MKMNKQTVSPELPSILHGTLLAIAALALSFIATWMSVEPPAAKYNKVQPPARLTASFDLLRFP